MCQNHKVDERSMLITGVAIYVERKGGWHTNFIIYLTDAKSCIIRRVCLIDKGPLHYLFLRIPSVHVIHVKMSRYVIHPAHALIKKTFLQV